MTPPHTHTPAPLPRCHLWLCGGALCWGGGQRDRGAAAHLAAAGGALRPDLLRCICSPLLPPIFPCTACSLMFCPCVAASPEWFTLLSAPLRLGHSVFSSVSLSLLTQQASPESMGRLLGATETAMSLCRTLAPPAGRCGAGHGGLGCGPPLLWSAGPWRAALAVAHATPGLAGEEARVTVVGLVEPSQPARQEYRVEIDSGVRRVVVAPLHNARVRSCRLVGPIAFQSSGAARRERPVRLSRRKYTGCTTGKPTQPQRVS